MNHFYGQLFYTSGKFIFFIGIISLYNLQETRKNALKHLLRCNFMMIEEKNPIEIEKKRHLKNGTDFYIGIWRNKII